jgi:hypothetical protein
MLADRLADPASQPHLCGSHTSSFFHNRVHPRSTVYEKERLMIESTLLVLLSIVTILTVWIVFGVLACMLACGLSCGTRGICRKVTRTWAHHHG